jgi:hypothetical protein
MRRPNYSLSIKRTMANYYATARSNYFRVKDAASFEAWCKKRQLDCWTKHYDDVGQRYAISPEEGCDAGWSHYDIEHDAEIDLFAELAEHLDPRDVAVLIEIGSEKLRYLIGEAVAVHSSGRTVRVNLDEIYDKALAELDGDLTVTETVY